MHKKPHRLFENRIFTFVPGTSPRIRKRRKERPADVKPGKSLGVGFYWNSVNTWLCLNRGL
jgi:hypothetical protein